MGLQLKFGVTQMPALSAYVYADTGLNAKASVSTFNDGKTPKKCTTFMAYLYARYGAHASSRFVKAYNKTETVYDKKITARSEYVIITKIIKRFQNVRVEMQVLSITRNIIPVMHQAAGMGAWAHMGWTIQAFRFRFGNIR